MTPSWIFSLELAGFCQTLTFSGLTQVVLSCFISFVSPCIFGEIFQFPFVSDLHCPIDWLHQMVNKGLKG